MTNADDAILAGLVHVFDRELAGDPGGNRIFVRWVDRRGQAGGDWDDWSLAGLVRRGGVEWVKDGAEILSPQVASALALGQSCGRLDPEPFLHLWWCRVGPDGPNQPRASNWAG